MERLTKRRIDDGEAYLACVELRKDECDGQCTICWRAGDAVDRLAAYEDTGFSPEEIKSTFTQDALIKLAAQALETTPERLRELAAADNERRVVVMPCKVGKKIYYINGKYIIEVEVTYYTVDENGAGLFVGETYNPETGGTYQCNMRTERIGKDVFLTREEAEQAMEGHKHD